MASLSELVNYAQAKQPRNGLAEIAGHFLIGADQGYEAGKKAQLDRYDQILKSAQALKAAEEARGQKMQNDLWDSYVNSAKAQGTIPLTAGETMNGKTVTQNLLGDQPAPVTGMARIASLFSPPDGMTASKMSIKLPGKMGQIDYATPGAAKPKAGPRAFKPDNPLNQEREDRIVWDKATARALQMAQAENPLATFEDAKKYLPTAFQTLGKDPKDYLKDSPLAQPPAANNDPWGLLKGTAPATGQ